MFGTLVIFQGFVEGKSLHDTYHIWPVLINKIHKF